MIYDLLMCVQETSALHLGMAHQTWPQDDTRPPVSVTGTARQPPLQDHARRIMSRTGMAPLMPARDLATHPMLPTAITARLATLNHSSSNRTDLPTSQLSGSEGSITLVEVFAWPVPHFLAAATLVGHSGLLLLLLRLEAPPSQLVSRTTGSLAARGGMAVSAPQLLLSLLRSKGLREARAMAVLGGSLGLSSTTRGKPGRRSPTWARHHSSRTAGSREELVQRVGMGGAISEAKE